ncbi:hypothetical protein G4D61_11210 [Bacillus ginsengihumi]|uniref:Uncharacterized protein n=1 Tax=Heyndrickxia ginsengihumi TaxID=363870 RepID=A0A6M0P747_9BACI|nr:hypothetical protein [Heyndrickxia ginsengihumi]NEY20524.1 hypothetical protein [Heyndrickxia ginsengihumi]
MSSNALESSFKELIAEFNTIPYTQRGKVATYMLSLFQYTFDKDGKQSMSKEEIHKWLNKAIKHSKAE